MDVAKRFAAGRGVVATANLGTIFQREIFFQVDPMDLDYLDHAEVQELLPSGLAVEFNPDDYLPYLPELEAEIFWMIFTKQMAQKNIALLLKLSQPTISYRYRRVLVKLAYLMVLRLIKVELMVQDLGFLREQEQKILIDLFYYTNQEKVGKKHEVKQSSVKWVLVKTKRLLAEMELNDPESWSRYYGAILLLERNLSTRVIY